ncbi:hypothetical protein KKD19_07045 [Patescibacteria group bacterium]|nr:hypothetical protein [Patescibacteria group bacterium]MBU4512960.1 hypothetical protein [Patescibacteria group bacterium]MCG2692996.1 hypothetical protein [Candidatus Parcubacteria bacterium]
MSEKFNPKTEEISQEGEISLELKQKLEKLKDELSKTSAKGLLNFLKSIARGGIYSVPETGERAYDGKLSEKKVQQDAENSVIEAIDELLKSR